MNKEQKLNKINLNIDLLNLNYKKAKHKSFVILLILTIFSVIIISACIYIIVYLSSKNANDIKFKYEILTIPILTIFVVLPFFICVIVWKSMVNIHKFNLIFYKVEMLTKQYKNNVGKFKSKDKLEIYSSEILFLLNQSKS